MYCVLLLYQSNLRQVNTVLIWIYREKYSLTLDVLFIFHCLLTVSRPSLVENVESIVTDTTNFHCEIETELSKIARRAGFGCNKHHWRQYSDKLGPLP